MNKLFFSQRILDSLIDDGKITLDKNILTLLSGDHPSFELEQAVRIVRTADGSPDPHGLVGRIKGHKDIAAMNAEVYLNSLIFADVAYEVEPGFIGEKKELLDSLSDADLLAKFLLESLF